METPNALLEKSWVKQVDALRRLSRKEMEVLWFLLQEHEEAFERLKIAVFSILRDWYEAQVEGRIGPKSGRDRQQRNAIPGFQTMKNLGEIRQIAQTRDEKALESLSKTELNVLLATLNRFRVVANEEEAFTEFFLKVAGRIRNEPR